MSTPYTLTLTLTDMDDETTLALAQFVKRVGWQEFRGNAVDDAEAHQIRYAVDRLMIAPADAGWAPR
jgi:hypothetical protein